MTVAAHLKSVPKLASLALLAPVVFGMHLAGIGGLWLFVVSAAAILGTVVLSGEATEDYAVYAGSVRGGLLNATFGDGAPRMIAHGQRPPPMRAQRSARTRV